MTQTTRLASAAALLAVLGGLVYHAFRGAHASSNIVVEFLVAFVGAVAFVAIAHAISPDRHRTIGH